MTLRKNYEPCMEGLGSCIHVAGNFTCNNASNPVVFSNGPFTVTRSAAGRLLVTFKENFVEFISGDSQVLDATGGSKACFIDASTITVGTASVNASFIIETQSVAGTKADLTGAVISFDTNWRKGTLKK